MIGVPPGDWPDAGVHETAERLLDDLDTDRALGYAVVAFTDEGHGGVRYATTGDGKMKMMAEIQLLALLLRAVSENHGKPPEETADLATAVLLAEDVLNGAAAFADLAADVDDPIASDWTDVDVEGTGDEE